MSRRIDIELTSALGDGTWTWRAAGARQPKGVVDGSVLPADAKVGDELKVEVEQEIDGITVLGIVQTRQKSEPDLVELLPAERDFQPVVETRAKRDRNDRGGRGGRDGDRRPRRDRDDRGPGRGRDGRGPGGGRGDRGGDGREDRASDGRGGGRGDGRRRDGDRGRRGPSFTPPPEVPMRPKPKRLRPGKTHRSAVLAELPEEQRAIAELALQGMGAVRQRVREENQKAVAEGRPEMPEASVMKIAEELLPKLHLAEWLDRAEAAKRQMEHLDLRDLRSVVATSSDPHVARDENTHDLVRELKEALVHKQEQELLLWFGDVDAALAVGRVIRALRLSSQPPKAGVPFPVDIAQRLADSVNASLSPMDTPERWSAMLEAAAFSPIRSLIKPVRKPDVVNDELLATVKRLGPALPQIAELFEIEVDPKASMPKPLRPNYRKDGESGGRDSNRKDSRGRGGKDRKPKGADVRKSAAPKKSGTGGDAPKPVADTEASGSTETAPTPVDSLSDVEPVEATPTALDSDAPPAAPADTEPAQAESAPAAAAEAEPAAPVDTEPAQVESAPAAAAEAEPATPADTEPAAPAETEPAQVESAPAAAAEAEAAAVQEAPAPADPQTEPAPADGDDEPAPD